MRPLDTPELSSSRSPGRSRFRLRFSAVLGAACLLVAACGGADDTVETGGDTGQVEGSGGDASAGSGGEAGGGNGAPVLETNPGALGTEPLTLSDVRVFEPGGEVVRTVPIDPVVNTCDTLAGSELTSIVQQLSDEESFGDGPVFADGELLGSACTYRSDTHGLRVIIGSAAEASPDASDLIADFFAGDITGTPWATDPSITVFSEDSFDLDTPFGAHAEVGEYGVLVHNASGTGIDYGSKGELFARMTQAVVANIAAAGPAVPIDEALNIQTARPCSLFTAEEIAAFLPDGALQPNENGDLEKLQAPTECVWGSTSDGISVRIDIEHASTAGDRSGETPSEASSAVFFNPFLENAWVVTDIAVVRVRMSGAEENGVPENEIDTSVAARQIAENLALRLGL